MTPEGITRKLIAILSADVKDYTRLMSQDDVGTIRTLAAYKEAMETLIRRYRGQVVDATGDNLLARFDSVLDAVNCAAEMQRDLAERNAELPDHRKMEFRMGISLRGCGGGRGPDLRGRGQHRRPPPGFGGGGRNLHLQHGASSRRGQAGLRLRGSGGADPEEHR